MNKAALALFCAGALLAAACTKPEDESPSKFQRQANIEKYARKAQDIGRLTQLRKEPLPVQTAADPARVTNTPYPLDLAPLTQSFERNRLTLRRRLLQTYAEQVRLQVEALYQQWQTQAAEQARVAQSPADLAQRLEALWPRQQTQLQQFTKTQRELNRLQPDASALARAEERLARRGEELLSGVALYYGDEAARQSRPVLEKNLQAYLSLQSQATTEAEVDARLAQSLIDMEKQLRQIVQQAGDPLGQTPPEVVSGLRTDLISAQQQLEKYIEPLYGKDAVLAARKVFNRFLEEYLKCWQENARLSQKRRTTQYLNEQYKQTLAALQQQWNAAWDATVPLPPSPAT